MNHGSLFSGIGGFDLASEWVGWNNVFQVDNDKYCQKVLAKNFPNVDRYEDIKEFDGTKYKGAVDIISGGFPCQPFSHAGKRQGEADDRFLWFEMLRVIREAQPSWVVGENVAGIISMDGGKTLETILTSLEDEGYRSEVFVIPACGVGAWHRRDRVWIVANSLHRRNGQQREGYGQCEGGSKFKEPKSRTQHTEQFDKLDKSRRIKGVFANSNLFGEPTRFGCVQGEDGKISKRNDNAESNNTSELDATYSKCSNIQNYEYKQGSVGKTDKRREATGYKYGNIQTGEYWKFEPNVGRVANGIPKRVDRIKGLGNAIVPQVAYEIFKAINTVE